MKLVINNVVEAEFVSTKDVLTYFNGLIKKYQDDIGGIPVVCKRFSSKAAGFKRLNNLISQINSAELDVPKEPAKASKPKTNKKPTKSKTKEQPASKKAKAPKKDPKAKKKAKKKSSMVDEAKVKKANIKKCIVNKADGDFAPVKTAYKIFDTFYKDETFTRQEYILICVKAGVKPNTAARQWVGKVNEFNNRKKKK